VASTDVDVEVLEQADGRMAAGGGTVIARKFDELDVVRDGQRPRQVGQKDDARLERRDEQRLQPVVVCGDLTAELGDARGYLGSREVDLAGGRLVRYDASFRPYRWARRSISRR
jgi:hypothetical protein